MRKVFILITELITFITAGQAQNLPSSLVNANEYKPKTAAFITPTTLIGYGMAIFAGNNVIKNLDLTTKNELQEDHPLFAIHADDYLQFVPAAAVCSFHLAGIKGKHDLVDATKLFLLSEGLMGGLHLIPSHLATLQMLLRQLSF